MEIVTVRTQIRTVAERWHSQYAPLDSRANYRQGEQRAIYEKLLALDVETATAADVAAIIGNDLWVETPTCEECGKKKPAVVILGGLWTDDGRGEGICLSCVTKAGQLLLAQGL